jgi:hypothetical protein
MARNLPRSQRSQWLSLGSRFVTLVTLSEIEWYTSHWDPVVKRARRCAEERCACCAMGLSKMHRYVVRVLDGQGEVYWLELGKPQRAAIEELHRRGGAGWTIKARKEGTAANAVRVVQVTDQPRVFVHQQDISRFVAGLGLPAIQLQDVEAVEALSTGLDAVEVRRELPPEIADAAVAAVAAVEASEVEAAAAALVGVDGLRVAPPEEASLGTHRRYPSSKTKVEREEDGALFETNPIAERAARRLSMWGNRNEGTSS